jgi:DNA-binding transcriptional regulator YiaG
VEELKWGPHKVGEKIMMPQINIDLCSSCGGKLKSPEKAKNYIYNGFGFPVLLTNAATVTTCETCGESEYTVPNMPGLMAAVALQRVMLPYKFAAADVRFVRKAIGNHVSSAQLAKLIAVTPETFSRWENDKLPISLTTEKLLRIVVGIMLKDKAPAMAMEFDVEKIANLQINAAWNPNDRIEEMAFDLVRVRRPENKKSEDGYLLQETEARVAVAR